MEDEEHVIFGCPETLEIFALTLVVNVDVYLKLSPVCFTQMIHCLI